jgi:hypothetical protein
VTDAQANSANYIPLESCEDIVEFLTSLLRIHAKAVLISCSEESREAKEEQEQEQEQARFISYWSFSIFHFLFLDPGLL